MTARPDSTNEQHCAENTGRMVIHIEPDQIRIPLHLMQPLPKPVCCQHPSVTYGTPDKQDGSVMVDVECNEPSCMHRWRQVKVLSRTIRDQQGDARSIPGWKGER